MALAIDIDRCDTSNEMRHKLQPKKTKVKLYKVKVQGKAAIYKATKEVLPNLYY